jgi:dipeptide/tripeptide permease
MTRGRFALGMAVVTVAVVEALAIALFLLVPEKREYWIIAALTMPILWTGAELLNRGNASLRLSVSYAAVTLAAAEALAIARAVGAIAPDDESYALRGLGIFCGLVIVVCGNMVPKKGACIDPASPDAGRKQALQRYSGWVLVLAGLANTLIWVLAPIKQAAFLSMAPLAIGVLLIIIRITTFKSMQGNRA